MSAWSDLRLVAGREVYEKLHSRAFVLSTLLFLGLVAASIALPALLYDEGPEEYDLAVQGAAARVLAEAVPGDEVDLTLRTVDGQDEIRRLLDDGDIDAVLEVDAAGLALTALQEVPADLQEALATTAQAGAVQEALADAGVTGTEVTRLLGPVPVDVRLLDQSGVSPDIIQLLGLAFGLLFFFVVYQFGYAIAQGVVQEKESRVVELLVTAVPVRTLLFGKVLGLGALALAQVVLLVAVAIGGAAVSGESEVVRVLAGSAGWFVLFFVLGFAMLSCLWAAAGAFASRSEDLQSTTAPLQILVIVPFFASVYVPEGAARTALSFFPLSAPLMMPSRLLAGDAAVWEAVVSAVLLLTAAAGAVLVGERLYRASLLRTRGRTSVREAWSGRAASGS